MADHLMNTKEAALRLGVQPGTLEVWRVYGKGPKFRKLGRAVRYREMDLEAYLSECLKGSTSEYGISQGKGCGSFV